jgi:hypothetical protein
MKNMLRRDTVHKQCQTTTKGIKTPTDVREHLSNRFSSEAWEKAHECGSINRIVVMEAVIGDIVRPSQEEDFESVCGIRKSFGFLSISDGRVDQREFDCHCHPCIMAGGHSLGTMSPDSLIPACDHHGQSAHKWYQCDVSLLGLRGIGGRRKAAQAAGHKFIAKLKPGSRVAVQNRGEMNGDNYWVGIALDVGDGTCVVRECTERSEWIQGTELTRGDYAVAVQWLTRDDADSERLTFLDPDTPPAQQEVFNSTELRCIDLNLVEKKSVAPAGARTRSGRVAPREIRYVLRGDEENVILDACW